MAYINRRQFLGRATAATLASGAVSLGSLAKQRAFAANVSGYRAIVCVFLHGGMDHNDTVLPYDASSYDTLKELRSTLFNVYGANRDQSALIPLNTQNAGDFGNRQFALPTELADIAALYNDGDAAIIGSIGTLVEPTSRLGIENRTAVMPPRLYSHNDQQSAWMSLGTEGSRYGWGGLFADRVAAMTGDPLARQFSAMSTSGGTVFLAGENTRQFRASNGGPRSVGILDKHWMFEDVYFNDRLRSLLGDHLSGRQENPSNIFMRDLVTMGREGMDANAAFSAAWESGGGLITEFPDNHLGHQLKTVAETISIHSAFNVPRQIFYVSIGGFDTHSAQDYNLPPLHQTLNDGVAAFAAAMKELGMFDDVTLFTASDFGRTLAENGNGTDHGWGGHHFVVGGGVRGSRIYGDMPTPYLDDDLYTDRNGRLIPQVSVEQHAATLGKWFGLDTNELNSALPNLVNFDTKDLGFLG